MLPSMTQNMFSSKEFSSGDQTSGGDQISGGDRAASAAVLADIVRDSFRLGRLSPMQLTRFARYSPDGQRWALDAHFDLTAAKLIAAGWTPADIDMFCQRKSKHEAGHHLLDVVAAYTSCYPPQVVDARWQAQLNTLNARAWWSDGASPVSEWARQERIGWADAAIVLISLLVEVSYLPHLALILPPPGTVVTAHSVTSDNPDLAAINNRMLGKVRALLAKAESTEFAEEAEALSAKAQQLMTQYSIDHALLERSHTVRSVPTARRIWLDAPYVSAKLSLVSAVAETNGCQAVFLKTLGCVTLVGHESDLDVVEILATSLLLQATRALTASSPPAHQGGSRNRSFKQSFLVAYAHRIGERLRQAARRAQEAADVQHGGSLMPVLVARSRAVESQVKELFPRVRQTTVSSSNADGWMAGRRAADQAELEVRNATARLSIESNRRAG